MEIESWLERDESFDDGGSEDEDTRLLGEIALWNNRIENADRLIRKGIQSIDSLRNFTALMEEVVKLYKELDQRTKAYGNQDIIDYYQEVKQKADAFLKNELQTEPQLSQQRKKIYDSYWNKMTENELWALRDDLYFKDYKNHVYFMTPKNLSSGRHQDESLVQYGRIEKTNGNVEIYVELDEGEVGWHNFSIFDDTLFIWRKNPDDWDSYDIVGVEVNTRKVRVKKKLKNVNNLDLVLVNDFHELVCLISVAGRLCIKNLKNGKMQELKGVYSADWDVAILGYNERYIYYWTGPENYCCIDIDTFVITDLSAEIDNHIKEKKEIYLIDCRTDTVYLKDGDQLCGYQRGDYKQIKVKIPNGTGDKAYQKYLFNGCLWIGTRGIYENYDNVVSNTIATFNKIGEAIGNDVHVVCDFEEQPRLAYCFPRAIGAWLPKEDKNGRFFDILQTFSVDMNGCLSGNMGKICIQCKKGGRAEGIMISWH